MIFQRFEMPSGERRYIGTNDNRVRRSMKKQMAESGYTKCRTVTPRTFRRHCGRNRVQRKRVFTEAVRCLRSGNIPVWIVGY